MAFWRKGGKKKAGEDPQPFVARREYDKAIKAYRSLIAAEPGKYVHHHKVADVLCMAGKQSQSIDDYAKAADGYANDGYLIKAIAILKKMQKIDPGNAEVTRKLDALSTPSSAGNLGDSDSGSESDSSGGGPEISLDMEMIDDSPSMDEMAAPEEKPAAAPVEETPAASEDEDDELVSTPLFSELEPAELKDVVTRLKHHSYPPETILVKEGDPGDSLFVVCEGKVEVSTAGPKGKPIKLAELQEGDFFGEVSLLTGKPRTATITSLDETEVLELTRSDLDELESKHPRVRQVIKEFYERRVASTVEAMLQAVKSPGAGSGN
jgi:cAMP-dependent protein kinase regulator